MKELLDKATMIFQPIAVMNLQRNILKTSDGGATNLIST